MGEWTVSNVCGPKSKIDHFTCKFLYSIDLTDFFFKKMFLGHGIWCQGCAWMHSTQLCTGIRRRTHQGQVIGPSIGGSITDFSFGTVYYCSTLLQLLSLHVSLYFSSSQLITLILSSISWSQLLCQ